MLKTQTRPMKEEVYSRSRFNALEVLSCSQEEGAKEGVDNALLTAQGLKPTDMDIGSQSTSKSPMDMAMKWAMMT